MDRVLRIENVWVLGLLLVAALVGLGARWRDDPRHGRAVKVINRTIQSGLAVLAVAVALFLAAVLFLGPIGP